MRAACEAGTTRARRDALAVYLSDHVLDGQHFLCSHKKECEASQAGVFYEGQLHHLGRHYDLTYDGIPHRVVVVGQEFGHPPPRVSLEERYAMLMESALTCRFFAEPDRPPRNPHMRGTTSALRLLHGRQPGHLHDDEFLRIEDIGRVHLFDTFALVNFLLCSAVKPESRTGISTATMKANCAEHFREALMILAPTVLVVQGIGFWPLVRATLDCVRQITPTHFEASLSGSAITIAAFSHPSAAFPKNWGANDKTPYLRQVVQPTLDAIWHDAFAGRRTGRR